MLAPGTSCGSSWLGDGSADGSRGASKSIGSAGPAEGSPLGRGGSAAPDAPTWRSGGPSGWKSSTAGASDAACGAGSMSETALDEVLSDGPSVIPGPFPIPSPVTFSGSPRLMGSRTVYPPGADEFLCSGYV